MLENAMTFNGALHAVRSDRVLDHAHRNTVSTLVLCVFSTLLQGKYSQNPGVATVTPLGAGAEKCTDMFARVPAHTPVEWQNSSITICAISE